MGELLIQKALLWGAFTMDTGEGGRVWRQYIGSGRPCERPSVKTQQCVLMWCMVNSNGLSAACSLHSNLIEKSPHHKYSLSHRPEALSTSSQVLRVLLPCQTLELVK